jgi:protocatechuate 3,4-dioxygenase beta subunit
MVNKMKTFERFIFIGFFCLAVTLPATRSALAAGCKPTRPDSLGPFYKPNAPVRSSVGKGYLLSGVVKSAEDCSLIPEARIEFWLTGPDGNYNDDYRATVFSDTSGKYNFESNLPKDYAFRPPHIHVRISAAGYKTLVTQHYPAKGKSQGRFDLVLKPQK